MSRLDDELRNALRREEPSPAFAERVLACVKSPPAPRHWWSLPPMRWAAAAAIVVLLASGVEIERQRRIRAQGKFAKEQVMLALRITGSKLQFVREKIHAIDNTQH